MTVIFFALFGSLFVLTQYLQLVHGYSPLSAGLRAPPFAIAMAATSPVSPILARRFGTWLVIPAGIALMGAGLLDLSTAGVHTAYPPLALAVAIMGAGMGLVMAPASTTIMTTVPAHQAGAGSAINDTIREVGGALGIAIVGSLSAAATASGSGWPGVAELGVPVVPAPGGEVEDVPDRREQRPPVSPRSKGSDPSVTPRCTPRSALSPGITSAPSCTPPEPGSHPVPTCWLLPASARRRGPARWSRSRRCCTAT